MITKFIDEAAVDISITGDDLMFISGKQVTVDNLTLAIVKPASISNVLVNFRRTGDIIYDILDRFTGDYFSATKAVYLDSGDPIGLNDVDNIIYFRIPSGEFFKRNIINNIVDLSWFGMLGDGTNEHDKIQKAIYTAANKTLWIPKGIFYTTKLEGVSNITIDGVGTLKAHSAIATNDPTILFYQKTNFLIKNIFFNGNKGVVPGTDQVGSPNIIISGCSNAEIDNIKVNDNGYVAVAIYNSNRIKTNNSSYINTDCGVIHFGGDNWECLNNYAEGGTSDGFVAWGQPNQYVTNVTMKGNRTKDKVIAHEFRYADGFDCSGNFANDCVNGVGSQALNNIASNGKITKNTLVQCWIGVSGVFNDTVIQTNTIVRSKYHAVMIGLVELIDGSAVGRSDLISRNVVTSKNILIDNVTDDTRGWGIIYSNVKGGEIEGNIIKDTKSTVLTNNPILLASICNGIKISNNDTLGFVEGFDIKIQSGVLNSQISVNNGTVDNAGTTTPMLFKTEISTTDDIEITDLTKSYIAKSPDGNRRKIVFNNDGTLTTAIIT